jgi:glycosyltransferase involved in cell wall biosynthesis
LLARRAGCYPAPRRFCLSGHVDTPRISVAIPVYNEEANVQELVARVQAALDAQPGGPHQIVIVDDGSADTTLDQLSALAEHDARLLVVALSRNFGHQAAITAALDHVDGDVVVVMDGDLQDSPEAIPSFLERYRAGYDVVYAIRAERKEALWLRACYALFYRLMNLLADIHMPTQSGDFGLISARVAAELRRIPERNRYVRGLRTWVGFRQIGVEVERQARFAGQPKYSFSRLVALAMEGLFAFSRKPIRAVTLVGMLMLLGGFAYSAYAVYAKLVLHQSPQGFTALILFMNFLAGVQLTFLGVIGEYVGRIYEEVKQRPSYIVRELRGRGAPAAAREPQPRERR